MSLDVMVLLLLVGAILCVGLLTAQLIVAVLIWMRKI
jgi:hypothetical protein